MKKRLLSILIIVAFMIADTRSAFAASGLFALSADAEAASQQLEEAETQETEVQETEAVDLLQQETEEQDGEEQSGEKTEEPADETGEEAGEEPEELLAEDAGETVYPTGYVRPFNYRDPETAVSDSELLQGTLESRYISPVVNDLSLRNQNPYGTCWAFASMGLAEFSLLRQGIMTDADLSELHLAYFTFNGVADPLGNTAGDQAVSASKKGILNWGGNFDWAGNTMASWTGAAKEEKASYSGKATTINNGGSLDPSIAYDDIAHLRDIYRVSLHNNTDDVKELIKECGGAGVSFYAKDGLSPTTSERLYNRNTNSYYCDTAVQANHAVMIVGWDDQYSKDNFSATPEGDGAWLIRNSWTTGTYANSQSFAGYFWMSYYDKSLEDEATFFVFDDAGEYDNNYQYDGGVQDGYVYGARKIANVFKTQSEAGGTEQLKAVSFALYSANADYTVNIYKNLTNLSNPESGTKVLSQEGSTVYGGLHTVELNRTVELAQDETFSVVIDFNGTSQKVFYEYALDIGVCDFRTNAQSGQSFAQFGSSWSDFGAGYHGNLRIKAFTTNASEEQILPQRLTLEEGLAENGVTLNKEETHQVTWNVLPQEATDKKVLWESSDEGIATVSSTGLVTAVAQGSAVITGRTRAGDASASFTVTVTKELKGLQIVSGTDGNPVVGEECRFSAQTVPVGAPLNNTIFWSSSDPSILSVTETGGVATIHHAGTVTVTADAGDGITGTLTVTCILPAPASVSARASGSGITLTWTKVTNADKYRIAGTYHRSSGATTVKTFEKNSSSNFFTDDACPTDTVYVTYGVSAFENGIGGKTAYTTLYLVEQTYNITYHLGIGGNDPRNPHKLTQNEDVYLYDPIAPEGYDALGWYEAHLDGLTNSLPLLKNGVRWYTDYSLTAKYEPHTYQIRYFANSGSGVMSDTSATYGKSVTLRANAFTKPGYDFDGWNTEPDGSGTTYANRASVKNLTSKDNDVVRLYAMWSGAKFNVTLNAGKGTLLSGTKKVNSLTMQVETESVYRNLPTPERYGYDFTGWYTEEDGGGVLVKNGMDVLSDVTVLYAGWKAMNMLVTFDGNGETIPAIIPKTVTFGETYGTLKTPENNAEREFAGWFLEPECLTQITKNTVVTKAGAHTLYAGWMRKEKIATPVIFTSEGTDEIPSGGTVEIRCETAGVVIYYTTDGSEPSKGSSVYAGAFVLPVGNTTVKAIAVKNSELISEVSTRIIIVSGNGNEFGDLADHADDKALYIAKGRPSGIWMAGVDASGYAYSGANITPEVRIYDGTRLLKEKTDYTLKYQNNKNAYTRKQTDTGFSQTAAPAVTATFRGNYTGKLAAYFTIDPVTLTENDRINVPDVTFLYNGRLQKASPKITYVNDAGKAIALKAGKDYDLSEPSSFTDVNDYTVTVSGKGNYIGSRTFTVHVTDKTLISKAKIEKIADQNYSGGPVELHLTVTYNGETLEKGVDYQAVFTDNVDAGTASVTIRGMGDFAGETTKTFKIKGTPMSRVEIPSDFSLSTPYAQYYDDMQKKFIYTGSSFEVAGPESGTDNNGIILYFAGKSLNKGEDYTVSYLNNQKAGKATVVFTGKGGFTGSVKKTFAIAPYPSSGNKLGIAVADSFAYEKNGVKPEPVVTFQSQNGKVTLVKGTDYTLKYSANTAVNNAGNPNKAPKVTVVLKGNFKGTVVKTFAITDADLGTLWMEASDKMFLAKAGSSVTNFTITDKNGKTLKAGTDYEKNASFTYASDIRLANGALRREGTAVQKEDVVPAGTAIRVRVQGKGNYTGTLTGAYRIITADIAKADVKIEQKVYKGDAWILLGSDILSVTMDQGKTQLTPEDYYIAGYKNNTDKGTATVILKGRGNYGGTKSVTFVIKAKEP